MAAELKLIAIYLAVSDACRRIVGNGRLRRRGFAPALTDAEVITMEIFAEMQGHHSDSAIWRYFDAHWRHFFPTLPTRSVEFIPIKPLAATGSGGPGSYAGHSRFPSRHHGRPASTGGCGL